MKGGSYEKTVFYKFTWINISNFLQCQRKKIIEDYLETSSKLYTYSGELKDLMSFTNISGETIVANEESIDEELENILNELKNYFDEDVFNRLVKDRIIFDGELISGDYNRR